MWALKRELVPLDAGLPAIPGALPGGAVCFLFGGVVTVKGRDTTWYFILLISV